MTRLSTKVECRFLSHTTFELLWFESILFELNIGYFTPMSLCGNVKALMLSHNQSDRTCENKRHRI